MNLGNQTFHYVNTLLDPTQTTFNGVYNIGHGSLSVGGPGDLEFQIVGGMSTDHPIYFALTLYGPASPFQLANLAQLNSPVYTSSAFATEPTGNNYYWVDGPLTSFDLVSAPEPSMPMIFGVLAIAAMACRRFRRP